VRLRAVEFSRRAARGVLPLFDRKGKLIAPGRLELNPGLRRRATVPKLEDLGWNSFFASQLRPEDPRTYTPARVVEEQKNSYRIRAEAGDWMGELAGRMIHAALVRDDLPVVGDWVVVRARPGGDRATIHRVLARKTKFSRKAAGKRTSEQILAANIDTAFIVTSLNRELNLRRIERYLTLAWESGARPVVLLSKADLCPNAQQVADEVGAVAPGVPVQVISPLSGDGLGKILDYLGRGQTAVLLGSSGVGKSTLINRLMGRDILELRAIRRRDDRGRHTTASRHLILLPHSGMIIDTPGLRELQLWQSEGGLDQSFEDIGSLAERCRFTDCCHQAEPGCAVQEALSEGTLHPKRLENYRKLQKELAHLSVRQDVMLQQEQKKKWKQIHKAFRNFNKRA
jgi:ribosome biogenesis GTPase